MKEPKDKICKYSKCNKTFKEFNSLKIVCSTTCGIALSKEIHKEDRKVQQNEDKTRKAAFKVMKARVNAPKNKATLQNEINKLARKIDNHFDYKCICCDGSYGKQIDGCHLKSRGSNPSISFNLHNIHAGRSDCNQYSNTHISGFKEGLVARYSQEYLDMVWNDLALEYPVLKLNHIEIAEALAKVRKLIRDFDKHTQGNDLDGSIMRAYFNNLIGIYK